MSLIGNLEDLSLPDILQIISLSKKSGVLIIHRGEEEGRIYLRQGKVILTTSARGRRNLGNILLDKKILVQTQLQAALAAQKSGGNKDLLGSVLLKLGLINREDLEKIVQEQIEETVFYFLTWGEGTFKFDLKEVDPRLEVGVDPQLIISQKGIDTQWLVLEGTRLLDEHQRGAAAAPFQAPEEEGAAGRKTLRAVCLVDDDELFSEQFGRAARRRGLAVRRLPGVAEAKEYLGTISAKDAPAMVIDVVMPTADGRGFLGGVELARLLATQYPEVRFKVVTAYPDDSVEEELKKIKAAPLLLKPDMSDVGLQTAMEGFVNDIVKFLGAAPAAAPEAAPAADTTPAPPAPGKRPAPAFRTPAPPPSPDRPQTEPPKIQAPSPARPEKISGEARSPDEIPRIIRELEDILAGTPAYRLMAMDMIREAEQAQNPSEVGLIILRLASELLERAILFRISGGKASSLGGFGFEADVIRYRDGLRNLSISLDDSPLLRRATGEQRTLRAGEAALAEEDLLSMVIGQPLPSSWIVVPARGAGSAVLALYGDNGQGSKPIGGEQIIQKFIILAGLFMNRLLLSRAV